MDDDLPKEGELLDISKNRKSEVSKSVAISTETKPVKVPFALIGVLVIVALIAFFSKQSFGGKASPEELAIYKLNTQSIFDSMKAQFPYLTGVTCEGSDPSKADCVNFVATFRPDKGNPGYLSSMDTIDKVYGATPAEIELIKGHIKVLIDIKRTTLTSVRKPLTFLIDSTTVPRVGQEFSVKTRCTEGGGDAIVCEDQK